MVENNQHERTKYQDLRYRLNKEKIDNDGDAKDNVNIKEKLPSAVLRSGIFLSTGWICETTCDKGRKCIYYDSHSSYSLASEEGFDLFSGILSADLKKRIDIITGKYYAKLNRLFRERKFNTMTALLIAVLLYPKTKKPPTRLSTLRLS